MKPWNALPLCIALFSLLGGLAAPPAFADPAGRNTPEAYRDTVALFREEMQQVTAKLKWRGDRLSDDTIYVAALSGLSWLPAWQLERPFWLGWGELKKAPTRRRHSRQEFEALVAQISQRYRDRDYREAVALADAEFTLDEIGCHPALKEAVGGSRLALNQPEEALAIYATPFEPEKNSPETPELNRRFREGAFEAAQRLARRDTGGDYRRTAVAFAVSLLLSPDTEPCALHEPALRYLENSGADIARLALGVIQAPERMRGLAAYYYTAADLLTTRATPRMLPFLVHLAQSDDVYLRSRAVLGLGVLAYQTRPGDPPDWTRTHFRLALRPYGLSSGERKMIEQEIREALRSDLYRLRAAGALALALTGAEDAVSTLQKLTKDRAYTLSAPEKGRKNTPRQIAFPVRMAAAVGLARYGISVAPVGGALSGKELDRARRGNQDVTNDRRNLRKEMAATLAICTADDASQTL